MLVWVQQKGANGGAQVLCAKSCSLSRERPGTAVLLQTVTQGLTRQALHAEVAGAQPCASHERCHNALVVALGQVKLWHAQQLDAAQLQGHGQHHSVVQRGFQRCLLRRWSRDASRPSLHSIKLFDGLVARAEGWSRKAGQRELEAVRVPAYQAGSCRGALPSTAWNRAKRMQGPGWPRNAANECVKAHLCLTLWLPGPSQLQGEAAVGVPVHRGDCRVQGQRRVGVLQQQRDQLRIAALRREQARVCCWQQRHHACRQQAWAQSCVGLHDPQRAC